MSETESILNPSETPAPEAGAPGTPGTDWRAGLPEDVKGLAEARGWKEPAEAWKSAVVLPKDAEDKEGYERLYKALGRPEKPDEYGLTAALEGQAVDQDFLRTMSGAMHEAGLSTTQAMKLTENYQKVYTAAMEAAETQYQADLTEAKRTLPEPMKEEARRGFRLFGLPPDEATQVSQVIERGLGVKAATELFARIGRVLGEDRPVTGANPLGLGADGKQADPAKILYPNQN